jgi:signal transduction histidine kinase/DNA-binding response OmpR family regulator
MSKKQLNNRLDSLFAGFEEKEPSQPLETKEGFNSWSWSINPEGKYTECSPDVVDCLGLPSSSFLNRSFFTYVVSPDCSNELRAALNDNTFPAETEIKFISKSRELVTVRSTIFESVDEDGKRSGFHGINLEIGRQPLVQKQIEEKPIPRKSEPTATKKSSGSNGHAPEVAKPEVEEKAAPPTLFKSPVALMPSTTALTAPIQIGGKTEALLEVLGENPNRKWSEDERILVEEVARQLSLAIENARLYQDIRKALASLETRERYQANIARAVAILSELGTSALPDFLDALGQATLCDKITFTEFTAKGNPGWRPKEEWVNPAIEPVLKKNLWKIDSTSIPEWKKQLSEMGWATGTVNDAPSIERDYLKENRIGATLLLAVTYAGSEEPGFIAFDRVDANQPWQSEEISLLRVGVDAYSNTNSRQDLLVRLQSSLKETENLYNTSHRLAMATDLEGMVTVIMTGIQPHIFNRASLILFETDNQGKLNKIKVSANWYGGRGTPPPPVGSEYAANVYYRLFQNSSPQFFDDIYEAQIDPSLRDILSQQNARSAAILPLWANKRQTGVFLALSDERQHLVSVEMRSYPPLVDQMATAIENLNLFVQTEKALSETEALYQVGNRIAQATDISELVRLVAQKLLPKNAEAGSIFLANYSAEDKLTDLEMAGFMTSDGHYQPAEIKIPIMAMPFVTRLTSDIEIIPDIYKSNLDSISQKTLQQLNINAACIVPLRSAGRLVGLLVASSRNITNFNSDEAHFLQVAGSGIAVALERQRLLSDSERRALELQTAAEIARDTTSTLSLDTLLQRIVSLLISQFNFYHVGIYLLDEQSKFAVIREANGDSGQLMKKQGYKLASGNRSAVGSVISNGKPSIFNDVAQNPYFLAHPLLPETRSEMALPLKLGERIIGALDIQSKQLNAYSPDDVSILQILADQIAVAIENARSYELSQKALKDMQEVDRLKSQFLANMSHELRTPLNSIIGFSRVILKGIDGPINDTQQQDLSAIYNSGQHLLALITDILDLSKIEAGKMELQFTDINLSDLINSVMSTAVGLVKDKAIRLVQTVSTDLPTVRADATRVRQVIINFISNASKFTETGSITIEAEVVDGPNHKKEVMVSVTDTGLGIAAEDQSKLFQPFSQVDDSATRKTGGTGLGLSISRSLIEMHGGRIGLLRSEVGKGSTFFFTLPLKEEIPAVYAEVPVSAENVILSIDDDQQVINLYERYLRPYGFKVVPLNEPKKALAIAKQIKPFAITLDVMMPEKDGWEVLQELKNDPQTRQIPIIVCSILEDEEKGFSLGAADYLVKPFLQEELLNTINRLNPDGEINEILIIDDDPADLRLVEKMLQETGKFKTILAEGGKKGMEVIQAKTPDAIILDLFMPDLDGFTLLANLRSSPITSAIPVIVLTGADLTSEQHAKLAEYGQQLLEKGSLKEKDLLNTLQATLRSIRK